MSLLALLLALALPQHAAPMAPLDFLVGRCWRGEIAPGTLNTHCFEALADGSVRDRHIVVRGGETVYSGETRYESSDGVIRFVYSSGGQTVGEGEVRAIAGGLDFGASQYATANGPVTIASRWMRVGDNAYDSIDSAPDAPAFDHSIRYTRVD